MKNRRIIFDRGKRIEQWLHFIVFNFHQLERLFRRKSGFRGHSSNFFADESYQPVRENRVIIDAPADSQSGHVLSANNRFNAGNLAGLVGVDFLDAAVRDRAAQDLAPQYVWQLHIGAVKRSSSNLRLTLDSRCRSSYDLCHSLPPRTSRLLKKTHMLRCARPTRFNVLKRTPQLIELRAPRL